jgi:hypothetical protein
MTRAQATADRAVSIRQYLLRKMKRIDRAHAQRSPRLASSLQATGKSLGVAESQEISILRP